MALYSVVNLTYLFIWKDDELIRALACAATENDGASWINIGVRQPCEQRAIDMNARRWSPERERLAAMIMRRQPTPEQLAGPTWSYPTTGEWMVFELFDELLGARPDRYKQGEMCLSDHPANAYRPLWR